MATLGIVLGSMFDDKGRLRAPAVLPASSPRAEDGTLDKLVLAGHGRVYHDQLRAARPDGIRGGEVVMVEDSGGYPVFFVGHNAWQESVATVIVLALPTINALAGKMSGGMLPTLMVPTIGLGRMVASSIDPNPRYVLATAMQTVAPALNNIGGIEYVQYYDPTGNRAQQIREIEAELPRDLHLTPAQLHAMHEPS